MNKLTKSKSKKSLLNVEMHFQNILIKIILNI